MDIGQRIREVREDLGMQATVLARRVEVAPNTIYRIESGDRTPSMTLLEKIARELRTEPAELLREPVPLDEAPQETGRWGREAHGLAPYAAPEERRAVLNEVGRDVQYAIGRAEYWEQELERGRTTQYSRASSAENLAILARDEFSEINRWLGEEVAPGLDAQIERGLASEIADEYVVLMDTFVERVIQTQHALFDHAARVAETQAQQDALAKLRENADRGVKIRPRSTKSA